jgi:hypothetical protein
MFCETLPPGGLRISPPKTTSNFRSGRLQGIISQEFCFIEYGHDGYQKNPLSIQIPENSNYLCDKMHPKQDILKQKFFRGPILSFS